MLIVLVGVQGRGGVAGGLNVGDIFPRSQFERQMNVFECQCPSGTEEVFCH